MLFSAYLRGQDRLVGACAIQRRSARAGGECNWEKFNCVVWSKQTEAAIPALERDYTGRFISPPQTKSDWTTGIWPESFSSLPSESKYHRYKGPFRWGINSVHGVVPHVGLFSSKQMWRTRSANAVCIHLVLISCNNGCVCVWRSACVIQLRAFLNVFLWFAFGSLIFKISTPTVPGRKSTKSRPSARPRVALEWQSRGQSEGMIPPTVRSVNLSRSSRAMTYMMASFALRPLVIKQRTIKYK